MDLSIIIAIYNAEIFLRTCLDSVKACPESNIECIMVNDGSTDGTREICKEFEGLDNRFKLINKENTGVSDSRNTGMLSAKGTYILFLDADDYLNADMWPELLAKIREAQYDMVAYSYYSLFNSGRIEKELFPDSTCNGGEESVRYTLLSTARLNPCWGKLLKRRVIEENGLRFRKDLKTCEDAVFIIDFVQNADKFLLLNKCLIFYRIHPGSAMRRTDINAKLDDFAALFSRRREYLAARPDAVAEVAMYRQCFSIITDLFRGYAAMESISDAAAAYERCMKKQVAWDIMEGTAVDSLSPIYKKLEYSLISGGHFILLALYFKLKSRFIKR